MVSASELRVSLAVDDYELVVAFYRDRLGLPEVQSWDGENGRGIVLSAGGGTVEILDRTHAAFVDDLEAAGVSSGPVRLALHVPDSRALSDGPDAVSTPVITPWGDVNVRLRAPEGPQVTVFTPAPPASTQ